MKIPFLQPKRIRDFKRRQKEFGRTGTRYYGDGGTIHHTNVVNVETDKKGNVVSVWFRCAMLPFDQRIVSEERAKSMRSVTNLPAIHGIEFKDV